MHNQFKQQGRRGRVSKGFREEVIAHLGFEAGQRNFLRRLIGVSFLG
jgi:hypothetical protein